MDISGHKTISLSDFSNLPFKGAQFLSGEKTLPLHTMIIHCGHQKVSDSGYKWNGLERGNREFAIWQLSLKGEGRLYYEGKDYNVPAGTAMLLHIPHNHCYYYPPELREPWDFVYISFNGREFMRIWRILEDMAGPLINFTNKKKISDESHQRSDVEEFFKFTYSILYESICESKIGNSYLISAYAYTFLMKLCTICTAINIRTTSTLNLKKVINFCIDNISKSIGVDDMAEVAGYSRYHFTRIFKQSQGIAPAHFLLDLRMKYAMRMLQTEKTTVKEIAYKCGFKDTSYFCKIFKKFYTISPGEFRQNESLHGNLSDS